MIQRVQSIFLLLTAILMAVSVSAPMGVLVAQGSDQIFTVYSYCVKSVDVLTNTWGGLFFVSLGILMPFVNIFLFKNRKLQIKLGLVTSLVIVFFYITIGVYAYSIMGRENLILGGVQYGLVLPIVALVLNTMAVSKVKKDEKLVQSLNRIR